MIDNFMIVFLLESQAYNQDQFAKNSPYEYARLVEMKLHVAQSLPATHISFLNTCEPLHLNLKF